MAEVLAIVSAAIAVAQVTDRIVAACKAYITSFQNAPSHLRVVLVEISTLKPICDNIQFLVDAESNTSTSTRVSTKLQKPIEECHLLTKELEKLFPSEVTREAGHSSKRRKLKASLEQLAWPFKEHKAKRYLDDIRLLKETISLELTLQSL